ncbi:hypothetical protein Gotur_017788 [Gossypium turneri]
MLEPDCALTERDDSVYYEVLKISGKKLALLSCRLKKKRKF